MISNSYFVRRSLEITLTVPLSLYPWFSKCSWAEGYWRDKLPTEREITVGPKQELNFRNWRARWTTAAPVKIGVLKFEPEVRSSVNWLKFIKFGPSVHKYTYLCTSLPTKEETTTLNSLDNRQGRTQESVQGGLHFFSFKGDGARHRPYQSRGVGGWATMPPCVRWNLVLTAKLPVWLKDIGAHIILYIQGTINIEKEK